jgi:hypothetical protein
MVYPSRMKKEPLRSQDNTTLTISISKTLKSRIGIAAGVDKRKISPWCAIRLEELLDDIDAAAHKKAQERERQSSPAPAMAAENSDDVSDLPNRPRVDVEYPALRPLVKPPKPPKEQSN